MTMYRQDGMVGAINLATQEPMTFGPVVAPVILADQLYATDGLAALVVDRPAEDALSRGFTIKGDEGDEDGEGGIILNEIDRLDAIQHLTDGLRWARLHGAGAILMLVDDGLGLEQPLDLNRLRQVNDLLSYPATAITAGRERYEDPTKVNYGEPILYTLQPRSGQPFVVHETRLLRLSGDPLSYGTTTTLNLPWAGRSALEGCQGDLMRYRDALALTRAILERKQQPVHKMAGLAETLTLPDGEGERIVAGRLRTVDLMRGVFTTVAVDGADDFSVLDASVGGIDALLNGFRIALAASTGMPVPILFGEGLSGLGNSGSGEQGIYHARVRNLQERSLRPALERLVSVLWAQKSLRAAEPQKWRIDFRPLWSPSEAELAETALKRAQARKAEVEALDGLSALGYVGPDEGRRYVSESMPEYGVTEAPAGQGLSDDDEPPAP